ncbi:unnamed protein product [Schistosoma mattheei]|uniref:Uncharacterized protein n=1 Tax=Schistosoma mattheei TaxID=31246 RepID=A0A183NWG6_9TREM|nr:unnamed protein product [Schistosoma mattheei]
MLIKKMTVSSDQLQLLFERQQQRFKKSQLNALDNLRTWLLNHPYFGDVTVDKLISNLHTELENDCRTYKRVYESPRESLISGNVNEVVAPSGPEMSILETYPVVGSNPIASETPCTITDLSSSQKDDFLLNADEIIAVPAHEETENESSSIIKTMSYLNDSHVFDQTSYKNEENLSDASKDDEEPNKILIYADYSSDRSSTNEIFKRFDENFSQESNHNDLISSVADPYHLISSSGLPTQCWKYALNRAKLTVTWEYEDPTLFCVEDKVRKFSQDLNFESSKKKKGR